MQRKRFWIWAVAVGVFAVSPLALAAGYAQVAVRTFAADSPAGFPFVVFQDGSTSSNPPVASGFTTATAGSGSSIGEGYVNGLTGVARAWLQSDVAATSYVIGRNAGSRVEYIVVGEITLLGPAVPGPATFTAELEGLYSVASVLPNFQNFIEVRAEFYAGSSGPMFGNLYRACCSTGAFMFPFS